MSEPLLVCRESELLDAGLVGGVVRRGAPAPEGLDAVLAQAARFEQTVRGGGPLADVFVLERRQRQLSYWWQGPIGADPFGPGEFRRFSVLPDGGSVLVFASSVVTPDADARVTVSLTGTDVLVDDLVACAYRGPVDAAEERSATGTHSVFEGPDRRAPLVPSALVHLWGAERGELQRWAYTLFGRRTERDWVARRPMSVANTRPALYAKHLRGRLHEQLRP